MSTTDDRLADRAAVVTGSASGIGRAIARRFAEAGASVSTCGWFSDTHGNGPFL